MSKVDIHFSSETNEWYTPKKFFNDLNKEFNFTLDPCCTVSSAKCVKFYTKKENGLTQDWSNDICFVNPPYGREIRKWVKKAHDEHAKGATVVMLVPARTDTSYWHDYIFNKAEIRFLRGRIKFEDEKGNTKHPAPFPSAIVVFKKG
jgi:site-specific DNA-methyltransferase (adenine-specific)